MGDQLSIHYVGGKFYGFKRMIGGQRFYFGREFGIADEGHSNAKRAAVVASVYVQEWNGLKAAGELWTPAAKGRAKAMAKIVLGLHQPLDSTEMTEQPASQPASDATVAPAAGSTPAKPMMLHAAMEEYLKRVRERVSSGQLSDGRADTISFALRRAKRYMLDAPLNSVTLDTCRALVNHFVSRPIVPRTKKPMAPDTVIDTVIAARAFFADAADRGNWRAPASLDKCFGFRRDKLLTEDEMDERAKVKTFTIGELTTLWRFVHYERRQLYLLLGLNCGFTQREIATLRKTHCFLDGHQPHIKRRRHKTKVMGKWRLWPETAHLLRKHFAPESEKLALIHPKKNRPLIGKVAGSRYDVIRNEWDHVIRHAEQGHVASPDKTVAVLKLSFKYLRKTGSNLLRKIAGRDVAETYLAHTDRTMGKVYHNPDFKRLSHSLRRLRRRLQPMFDAAPSVLPDSAAALTKVGT